jgi:hypothetical protein
MKTDMQNLLAALALLTVSTLFCQPATAVAQGVAFTYQGRLTDNGTNFTGAGQFQFALVTSTNGSQQATAIATNTSGFITAIGVINGGSGYVTTPAVTISGGGGSGAAATANVSGGVVISITVTSAGIGYTSTPTVTIAAPPVKIDYTTHWSNDGTSVAGSEPSAAVSVGVSDGLFTVVLGDTTLANMTAIPAALFTSQPNLQLFVWFSDGVNGFAELNPPQNLTPTPYAIMADSASNLLGTLPTTQLTGTLPASQVSGSVSNSQLVNSSLTVNAGTGLSGGGTVALGGSTTLSNAGVTSLTGGGGVTVSAASGVVTLGSTATSSNTPYAIVSRNGSGSFSAGSLTLAGTLTLPAITGSSPDQMFSGGTLLMDADSNGNFSIGPGAGKSTRSGSYNTAVGDSALYSNTNGYENTAIGRVALFANTNGYQNTANGAFALFGNTSGSNNTAIGNSALYSNANGYQNTANGSFALYGNTSGYQNTANGFEALFSITNGIQNTAIGATALYSETSGEGNTAIGSEALNSLTDGNGNTAIGSDSLSLNSNGGYNIALGYQAGAYTTGSYNIDIGSGGAEGENGVIRIGGGGYDSTFIAGIYGTTVAGGVEVVVNDSGQLGVLSSSQRDKRDIQSMGDASDPLLELQPVTFKYKPGIDPVGTPQFGLVAEEVEKVAPDLVVHDQQHGIYTVRYQAVSAMLLNEFLKEHRAVQEQGAQMERQGAEIQSLKEELGKLKRLVNAKTGGGR